MRMRGMFGLGVLVTTITACGAQLPKGWENAERVTLTQREMGTPLPDAQESLEVTPGSKAVDVRLLNARFRCEQAVEGYVRRSTGRIELLVQPEDMNPSSVPKCDALYDVRVSLPATGGAQEVSVHRRPDSIGGEQEPRLVGTKTVTVAP